MLMQTTICRIMTEHLQSKIHSFSRYVLARTYTIKSNQSKSDQIKNQIKTS